MGSLVKCAGCGERCGSRPIGVYWRWMRADGVWKKYYHRLCVGCYAAKVLPLDVEHPGSEHLRCPQCGVDTEDDYDGVYSTSFPGKGPQVEVDAPFCDVHAADFRLWVIDHARDISTVEGAPEPLRQESGYTASATLRSLGRSDA